MLHFNRLDYYSLPTLPKGWSPPAWLPFEVGVLGGRLYFEFDEYDSILDLLNCTVGNPKENSASETGNLSVGLKSSQNEGLLNFLQEWLAFRRQGQDISHTPMGYICQGLPLRSDHPFWAFKKTEEQNGSSNSQFFAQGEDLAKDEYEDYFDSDEEGGFVVEHGDLIDLDE